ncbi:MAG: AI-2E family transporter [Lachnospiraceae bacterium]|nr:AI-2E family transporter [Lachnospiraceae bacterium]
MKHNMRYIKWGLTAFFVVLGGIISYYVIFHLNSLKSAISGVVVILMPIIDGMILGYLMTPVVNGIEHKLIKPIFKKLNINQKKRQRRTISIVVALLIIIAALYAFFSIIIPQIGNSIRTIIEQLPSYVDTITMWTSQLLENNPTIANRVTELINTYFSDIEAFINAKLMPQVNNLIMTISMSVVSILKEFWNLIIGFIISIYILASKETFAAQAKKITYAFLPTETANRFISNVRFANQTFGGFFVGKIADSIIIGLICFIGTSILGTPFCVLISVIIGVTNIVPFFGPFLGAVPSILLILFIDPMQALYFLIFVIVLQQVDGNIIGPKILGNSTGLSSFWVIFAITLFGGIWGIFGMIVGVPIFAILFAFLKSVIEMRLANKELSPETSKYLHLLAIDVETNQYVNFSEDTKKPFEKIDKFQIKNKENGQQKNNKSNNHSHNNNPPNNNNRNNRQNNNRSNHMKKTNTDNNQK